MRIGKTMWIAVAASATLLLVPALADVLRAYEDASPVAAGKASSPEQGEVPLPAIEHDPAIPASYPALALQEVRRMEALRQGTERP